MPFFPFKMPFAITNLMLKIFAIISILTVSFVTIRCSVFYGVFRVSYSHHLEKWWIKLLGTTRVLPRENTSDQKHYFCRYLLLRFFMNLDSNAPIGIFDSGIGGLTVAKAISDLLPSEQLIYLATQPICLMAINQKPPSKPFLLKSQMCYSTRVAKQ